MISKSQIKLITSLKQKKYRAIEGLFVAEGPKVIAELIASNMELHSHFSSEINAVENDKTHKITATELKKISFLTTANKSLALFEIPQISEVNKSGLTVVLDAIRDPGNLGTIIRLCDWFGVEQLVCSLDTVDCYNPKVIQATMGSIARVNVHYIDVSAFIKNTELPVYGGVMNGNSIYNEALPADAIVVLGNEANGISKVIMEQLTHRITIPQFGKSQETDSLNVATATAVLLSEFRRTTGM
ncbi:RNA methyltransferase [Patiriisocius marinistellae]|uniref:RNA methyltransferase n=1 Tax=Patiriisocius marinistellae TaxID=2494560 RepID=A0A5J4FXP6_9FLAO|nr:RNA methyltransferase [Patiriisocius marinistellae]GEQ87050.1 RNA methyltransferase [Patiriisocius marinistellae]